MAGSRRPCSLRRERWQEWAVDGFSQHRSKSRQRSLHNVRMCAKAVHRRDYTLIRSDASTPAPVSLFLRRPKLFDRSTRRFFRRRFASSAFSPPRTKLVSSSRHTDCKHGHLCCFDRYLASRGSDERARCRSARSVAERDAHRHARLQLEMGTRQECELLIVSARRQSDPY
jgi:hypothetical protein